MRLVRLAQASIISQRSEKAMSSVEKMEKGDTKEREERRRKPDFCIPSPGGLARDHEALDQQGRNVH